MPLRVISGSAGGLRLQIPKRHVLRPTQDRIRQVIFSSLAGRVPGARVLDLYAGTGSIGIEALSRGAAHATFVEENPEAVKCLRQNLEYCKLAGAVHQSEVLTWLETWKNDGTLFDLVFADPPYIKEAGSGAFDLPWTKIASLLRDSSLMIWEHSSERTSEIEGWEVTREKSYGETTLTFLRPLDKNKRNILSD